MSSHFVWVNRSKESLALDVKHPQAKAVLAKLIERADVFVQNLAPGAAERLGLGAAELRAKHPRLIWCGISGYGPAGPYAEKKAYDLLVQCETGLLSVTGTRRVAGEGGHSGRRHRGRHVRVVLDPGRADQARARRLPAPRSTSRCSSRSANGWGSPPISLRMADRPRRAQAPSTQPSLRTARFAPVTATAYSWGCRTTASSRVSARSCCQTPGWRSDARYATGPARDANRASLAGRNRAGICATHRRAVRRAARARGDRQCALEQHAGVLGPPAVGGARALARGAKRPRDRCRR